MLCHAPPMSKLLLPSLLAALGAFSTLTAQDAAPVVLTAAAPATAPAKTAKPAPPPPAPDDPFVKGSAGAKKPAPTPAEEAPRPVNYQALLETFDLSREDFVALLDEKGDDEARYRRVAEWMSAGRAKLVTFTALTVRSGMRRTVVESIDEVNYATELNPPQAEEDAAFPAAFETRNTGETLELELTVGEDGQHADVNIAPNFCRLVKFTDDFASPGRANSAVSQPRFATRKLTTAVRLTMNRPRLLGTLSAAGEDGTIAGQVRVVFLTVRPNAIPRARPEALAPGAGLLRMEYTFFSLDRAAARELWLAKAEPQICYDALRALVAERKARLEHASINVAPSGQRTVTDEIEELKFATEFNPPGIPDAAGGNSGGSSAPAAGEDKAPKAVSTASARAQLPPGDWPKKAMIPAVAAAFEVRNIGFTSEVEPVLGEDGATVDTNFALTFIRHLGPLEVTGIAKTYPPRPLFESRKFNGSASATVGAQQFLSTFNMPVESSVNGRKDDGRVWLGFVRVVLVE